MLLRVSLLASVLLLTACGGATVASGPPAVGRTFATAEEAPAFDGTAFQGARLYDLRAGVWLDEDALFAALAEPPLVFFGEQHETAPVQELELWMLERLFQRHGDVSLAMEHFQRDEQAVIDRYLAGEIDTATFERTAQVWPRYARYWKPLVERVKAEGRPLFGLNVPSEVLEGVYASYPKRPLDAFNGLGTRYDAQLPPRPLAPWDDTFQRYFFTGFDPAAHGSRMGMSAEEARQYFTDLAHIRDEAMGYWTAQALAAVGGRIFVVAGDWHVRTGLATPMRAVRYAGGGIAYKLVTTIPEGELESLKAGYEGQAVADYVITYR